MERQVIKDVGEIIKGNNTQMWRKAVMLLFLLVVCAGGWFGNELWNGLKECQKNTVPKERYLCDTARIESKLDQVNNKVDALLMSKWAAERNEPSRLGEPE